MPFSDYIPDNIVTRGVARPLAAIADYYMANRQQPAMPQQAIPMDPNMGYPLTPQQEAMYAQASPRRVVQLTPEEMAAYNAQRSPVDTSYSGSGADFGEPQAVQAVPQAEPVAQAERPLYPEREHELRRQDIRAKIAKANQVAGLMIQQNPQYADAVQSSLKRNIETFVNPELIKSFDELPEGKAAFERVKELNTAASKSAKLLSNQLKTFDNFMAAGDSEAARQYAVSSITKTLQSLTGQDAEQMSEFLRRNAALLSVPEILRQTNSNSWTKDSVGILLDRLQKGDAELIAANPERWAQFAKSAVNDYARTYNEAIQNDIINKTSPDFAKRIPGSDFMKTFDMPSQSVNITSRQSQDKIALAQRALNDPNASAAHKAAARKILGK
jgi:hypothetical protein